MSVTQIVMLWRRGDLSREAFIERYETQHKLIGEDVLVGFATRYVRRFLTPLDAGPDGPDVLTEITYPDRGTLDACSAFLREPERWAMIEADEATLFDRTRTRVFTVEERDSAMPPIG